jgi:hypothetical protein
MIMMMTDPDRVALSAFLPAFLFRFIRTIQSFMPTSTPTPFRRNVPPAIVTHLITPSDPRLPFHIAATLFSSRQHFGHGRPSITSHAFSPFICAAPLSRSSSISTPSSQQPFKKTCNQSHIPPSSPHSLQASTRTRTCVRLFMYLLPVAVFISHQKEGFDREETGAPKNAVRSEQYFIVVPIQETIIKSIKFVFFFSWKSPTIF